MQFLPVGGWMNDEQDYNIEILAVQQLWKANKTSFSCVFFPTDRTVQEQCCVAMLEDIMCTNGINTAKDLGSCDTLFSNTCETKTTKVRLSACKYALVFVCTEHEDVNTGWNHRLHRKSPSTKSVCITSRCWTARMEANDWWERWCGSACMCVCACERARAQWAGWGMSLQGGVELCAVREYKFSSDSQNRPQAHIQTPFTS